MFTLTGLHGSGKTHLCRILQEEGLTIINKREVLSKLYDSDKTALSFSDWMKNHYSIPGSGAASMMERILSTLSVRSSSKSLVFDAIHNLAEWETIIRQYPNSVLILVVSPKNIRNNRNSVDEQILDRRRIEYWHESLENNKCLMSEVSFTFNGTCHDNLQRKIVKELLHLI